MTKHMSEEEFRLHLFQAIEYLIAAAKHYGQNGFLGATSTHPDGSVWQVLVRPGIVPVVGITAPQPVIFSLN